MDRPNDALAAAVYMKMFGNEITAISITEESMKALLGDGKSDCYPVFILSVDHYALHHSNHSINILFSILNRVN